MTKLHSIYLKFTIHYISLTSYYIVNDTFRSKKNGRVNKMTKLHSIHIEFTLQNITLTDYYTVRDTFRSQIMTLYIMYCKLQVY